MSRLFQASDLHKRATSMHFALYLKRTFSPKYNETPLNTPPFLDLLNIKNDKKKSFFDWNIDSPSVHIGASVELQSTITTSENEMESTATINILSSESSPTFEDIGMQHPEQESSHPQSMITPIIDSETYEPEPTIEDLWLCGIEYDDIMDRIAEETTDEQTLTITDVSTMANDRTEEPEHQQEENTSLINNLFVPIQSSSNEISQNTLTNTEIRSSRDVIPYGYFRHPIASKNRIRYENELANNEMSSKMSYVKDCFSERPILVGPSTLFANGHVEISLLSIAPGNAIIYCPHTFYSSNMSDEKKFSNPIYLQSSQLEVENGYIKLNLTIARKCQNDFSSEDKSGKQYRWTRPRKYIIKHYPSGKEESVNMTPRKLKNKYHFDTMLIGIRQVQLQPDGVSYRADPNSPEILSNRFIGVNADDSPTKWGYDEYKLKILEMQISNEGVSTNQNNYCKVIVALEIPELYHCTLRSDCKQLEVKLITNGNLSEIYKIAFEETTQNPTYFAVNHYSINLLLTIVKETLQNQNNLWLEPLIEQVNITGFNHFRVEFCLQDVEMNDNSRRRSYSYSTVCSFELIDISESGSMIQVSNPENNELRQNDTMIDEMNGKRRNDDDDGNISGILPITKVFKTKNN